MAESSKISRRDLLTQNLWLPIAAGAVAGVVGGAGGNLLTAWVTERWAEVSSLSVTARLENDVVQYFDENGHSVPYAVRVS